jgi:hypothetical protein
LSRPSARASSKAALSESTSCWKSLLTFSIWASCCRFCSASVLREKNS